MTTTYRVTIKGRTSRRLDAAFAGWSVLSTDGVTHLVGDVRDQAELFGVLDQIRDLGIELVRLSPVAQVA
jgi:hypothetical protein